MGSLAVRVARGWRAWLCIVQAELGEFDAAHGRPERTVGCGSIRPSPRLLLFLILAAISLVACGQTYSYVCNERTCLASFEGPGEQDLSDARGPTVEVVTIDDGPSVTVRVDGKNAKLVKGKPRRVEGYVLTLSKLEGENVTLRIVSE